MDEQQSLPTVRPTVDESSMAGDNKNRTTIIVGVIALLIIVGLLIAGIVFLLSTDLDTTSRIRDIFIIFMALEFLVVGLALIVLMVQLATLINLLQNEVKPILESTNETVSTLRGTVAFLSDNLAEPVIKLNTYLAALKRALDLLNFTRR